MRVCVHKGGCMHKYISACVCTDVRKNDHCRLTRGDVVMDAQNGDKGQGNEMKDASSKQTLGFHHSQKKIGNETNTFIQTMLSNS